MSVVQLPPSYNLTDVKPASSASGQAVYSKIRSDNATYGAGDVIRLTIPTGNNMFLSAPDSFITGRIRPTFTGGAGAGAAMRMDGSIYSIFRRITVYHGSSMIENILNANRLYNALYDVQCGPSERTSGSVNLLTDETTGIGTNNYTYGAVMASGTTYSFSLCLPSILGSFAEKAIPLAFMGAAELYIEMELEAGVRAFTSRVGDSISGTTGIFTTAPTATYEISEFYYNACITNLAPDVAGVLRQAMMSRPVILPCISYRGEQRVVSASATSFSDKFSFQFSSCKGILWWLTNGLTANGAVINTNYNAAITTRAPGDLMEWWVSLNGQDFPPSHIKAGAEIPVADNVSSRIHGAECFAHLERFLNQNAAAGLQSVLTKELYCNSNTFASASAAPAGSTAGSDQGDAKKFVAALSLDRFDGENQRALSGVNTMSSQVQIALQFTTGVSQTMNLYAFAMFDLGLELVDGLLIARY